MIFLIIKYIDYTNYFDFTDPASGNSYQLDGHAWGQYHQKVDAGVKKSSGIRQLLPCKDEHRSAGSTGGCRLDGDPSFHESDVKSG